MTKVTVLAVAALLAAAGVAGLGGAGVAQATTSKRSAVMHEIQLTNFKVNANGTVTVFVKIRGWKMYPALVGKKTNKPDGGHWHIFVNGKYNNYSANATRGVTTKLEHGDYKIYVTLANDDHSPVKGTHKSKTVSVMVDG